MLKIETLKAKRKQKWTHQMNQLAPLQAPSKQQGTEAVRCKLRPRIRKRSLSVPGSVHGRRNGEPSVWLSGAGQGNGEPSVWLSSNGRRNGQPSVWLSVAGYNSSVSFEESSERQLLAIGRQFYTSTTRSANWITIHTTTEFDVLIQHLVIHDRSSSNPKKGSI